MLTKPFKHARTIKASILYSLVTGKLELHDILCRMVRQALGWGVGPLGGVVPSTHHPEVVIGGKAVVPATLKHVCFLGCLVGRLII